MMNDADQRAIEQLHQRDQRACLESDADTLLSLMDDDITLIPPRGEPTRGKQAVAAALRTHFEHFKGWRISEHVQEFDEVGGGTDLAFDWGRFRGAEISPEGRVVRQRARMMRILQRQADGFWKVYRTFWAEEESAGTDAIDEIRSLLRDINEAWVHGNPQTLEHYFHDDMTIVAPNLQVPGRGRAACVSSYADFVKRARVHEFKAAEPVIFVWGCTATAAYSYEIDWEADGRRTREKGNEIFVFAWSGGRWLALSRILLPPD